MPLRDLITDETSGKLSHTRLWSNLANAAMTTAFLKVVWTATASEGLGMLFLAYGGIVAGSQFASKFVSFKYGGGAGNGGAAPQPPAVK